MIVITPRSLRPLLTVTASRFAALLLLLLWGITAGHAQNRSAVLYYFTQEGCPACARMAPAINQIEADYPALDVRRMELTGPQGLEYRLLLMEAARVYRIERLAVPAVFVGTRVWVGVGDTIVEQIRGAVQECLADGCVDALARFADDSAAPDPSPPQMITGQDDTQRILGFDVDQLPILVSTLLIAFLDGFNPCSLWVLTFLLAMVMHTGSRSRVLLVGVVFLLVTALIYGLFIVGVVQAMNVIAHVPWIRIVVVVLALAMGAINIKDYFSFHAGISLSLSEERRGSIARRFSALTRHADRPGPLVVTTAGLAAGIAIIELPCTAGFPVVWSNLLAAAAVPTATFLALLAVYLLIYLLIELILVGGATIAFRRVVITERGGRLLKLFGGTIMVALALMLLISPQLMESLASMAAVFGTAAAFAVVISLVDARIRAAARRKQQREKRRRSRRKRR